MEKRALNIVVFPWLAFGHMLPYIELSKSLAIRGHKVTYISTPRNIQRFPKIPNHLSPLIQFVSFALPPVEHLTCGAESTNDLPAEKVHFLKKAFDGLEKAFSSFLETACSGEESKRPDWIIMDFSHHWLPKIARVYSIPCALFTVMPAYFLVYWGSPSKHAHSRKTLEDFTVPPSWITFPSNLAFRPYEARRFFSAERGDNASGTSDRDRSDLSILNCEFICIRSFFPLDFKWLSLLNDIYEKPVIPVGPLVPNTLDGNLPEKAIDGEVDIIDWLDQHDPKSVLYVALGSEATLTNEELQKLALGLEMSKVHFLWALRIPVGTTGDYTTTLPEGFLERIKGFGLVVTSWVPQIRVLAHESVGGFLTHCGWSSTMEALMFGHPLIMFPLILDQGLISRVLDEKKLGVEIPRNEEDGSFEREDVAKTVHLVMVEEEGMIFRHNAMKEKATFAEKGNDFHGASPEKYFDDFVDRLRNYKNVNCI